MKQKTFKIVLIFCWLIFVSDAINAQLVPQGITYQGLALNGSGNLIISQPINVKIGIYSPGVSAGTLEWEETHSVSTNQLGLFYFIIGQGVSTGGGSLSSFSSLNWAQPSRFIKIAMDETGGTSFVNIDTIQFLSVPYAMYSGEAANTSQLLRIDQLADVDTIGVSTGYVLKWNGSMWQPAADNDSDTALYAYNANYAASSDTANYALNVLSVVDTVLFSYNSDTAEYALNSGTSVNAFSSNYCDTATYALNTGSAFTYWNLTGNSGTNPAVNFIGTTDNVDFVIKTNNSERMRITSAGKVGIGTASPTASLHIVGNDGLLQTGVFGSGAALTMGAGTRMHWYPKKAAFRAGTSVGTEWDDVNIGNYSTCGGSGNRASGAYSTAMGQNNIASGINSVAMGVGCTASSVSSISMGNANVSQGVYTVAMGRGMIVSDSGAVGIGYHSNATGRYSLAFGAYTTASGNYSTTMGYYANSNGKSGSFVYADNSSTAATNSTANNQFVVRASGGVIFYSNAGLTAGVSLPAGGGSWSSVSDKNKKEHFKKENAESVLNKLANLEVTSWNYKSQSSSIRHIGPMAQDFYKAFGFGESDTTITTIDIDGISLIAIQALNSKTEELKQKANEVDELKAKIEKLENEKKFLEKRISLIETQLSSPTTLSLSNNRK
jgi:hypothetical protein